MPAVILGLSGVPDAGDDIVVVADAFGGHIAVFSTTDTNLRVIQRIPGHNIGGLVAHSEQGLLARYISR